MTLLARVGDEMGLHVVAEGVETAEQLEVVRALGLRLAQGHYWGRAVEPSGSAPPYAGALALGRL